MDKEKFTGAWRLIENEFRTEEGEVTYPLGRETIGRLNYGSQIVRVELGKDERGFLKFIDKVLDVLELPEAPEHSPNCQCCGYIW